MYDLKKGPYTSHRKLRPAYSVKLIFSYVVKGIKIKKTAKFVPRGAFVLKNYVTRNKPEIFQDFQETGPRSQSCSILGHDCTQRYDVIKNLIVA